LRNICKALQQISHLRDDIEIVYPVHLNPNVLKPVRKLLGGNPRIHLLPPLDYLTFIELLRRSFFILTDSGGIQEEAPSLRKPAIVMRDVTERPEGVRAGFVKVVGTRMEAIVDAAKHLLNDASAARRLKNTPNPYGDGHSARRILTIIGEHQTSLQARTRLHSPRLHSKYRREGASS
jgi:UDP-N-acetylglucosamine 2-epimerase (non-hydrolysing)